MRSAGHQVTFFSRRGPHDIEQTHAAYYPPCIDLEQLNFSDRIRQVPRIIYNSATAQAFRGFVREVRPQLIHAHNIYGGLTTSVLDVAEQTGIPVVLTAHDYKLVCPSYLALDHSKVCMACTGGRFYHCLIKCCHKASFVASAVYTAEAYLAVWGRKYDSIRTIICPSHFMRQTLLQNGFVSERLAYVPNAVDTTAITPAIGGGTYVLYAGRLSPEKGILTLLKAIETLQIPLRIIGDGPLRDQVETYIEQYHLQDRVKCMGHLDGEELAQVYREAAFCVIPSEWYENAPMSALEACAYGKPVIGADIGGIPELVEPGVTGLLFPAGDVASLRIRLETLWNEQASWGDMGSAARRRMEVYFSPERHADALIQVYTAAN